LFLAFFSIGGSKKGERLKKVCLYRFKPQFLTLLLSHMTRQQVIDDEKPQFLSFS
ncbi:unnamed protein product, partial [Prunus brigantina]